jgi:hypothetical protein
LKNLDDPRIDAAVVELQQMIRERYPEAAFTVAPEEDPEGIYITATVDVDDLDEVFDIVVERLLELQVEDGIPVHVIPVHPLERIWADLRVNDPAGSRLPLPIG